MFIKEQGYFKRFETDGTLDWSFPSDYINCALLNDYQRLVPRNYGGSEYIRWSEYHEYLNSYEIEQEYVEYSEELAKQLKVCIADHVNLRFLFSSLEISGLITIIFLWQQWMEDYIHFDRPSFKYDFISSRGAYQAIKIAATGFRGITPALAYNGYYVRSLSGFSLFRFSYALVSVLL
uniref:Uncharacterized protein n=1 Tax=Aegilops tauschii subsp. strangulata TaxID=200361 RepID=A0A453ITB4_AEGTS